MDLMSRRPPPALMICPFNLHLRTTWGLAPLCSSLRILILELDAPARSHHRSPTGRRRGSAHDLSDHDAPLPRHARTVLRSTVNVHEGISLHDRWERDDAIALDRNGHLKDEIDERVREATRTWGAETAWDSVCNDSGE